MSKNELFTRLTHAFEDYRGFTASEKEYCLEHVGEWMSKENSLNIISNELDEKFFLDVTPFLEAYDITK